MAPGYGAGRASGGGWGREVTTANGGVYPHMLTFLSQRSFACELALYLVLVARSHASPMGDRGGGGIRESSPFPLPFTASSLSCA